MEEKKNKYFDIQVDEVFNELDVSKDGLDNEEVKKRKDKYGPNKLREYKQKSLWEILLSQINNPVVYLLVAAATISFIFSDIPEGIAIVVVILLNTIIGFWMEYQARQSMQALRKMDRIMARVKRNDKSGQVDAEDIVPGDIIELEAGDLVPADARLFETSELQVDESPLTGESVPVEKNTNKVKSKTPVADRTCMVYKGTSVTGGKGMAIVTGTGMDTELGNISEMVTSADEESIPLNMKLKKLTKSLIWIILVLAGIFFLSGWLAGKEFYLMFQTAIAWAIAAIPEGLPIVASMALARGMLRLSRQNVIVKQLGAVETLGETTVIFTDKTGTLTENKLTVDTLFITGMGKKRVQYDHEKEKASIEGIESLEEDSSLHQILRISVFCNNADLGDDGNEMNGDPLEIALLQFVKYFDEEKYKTLREHERKNEDPFDSETKMMGTISAMEKGYYLAAKGAADAILNRADRIMINGKISELDEDNRKKWISKNDELSENGLRVLAYGYRELDEQDKDLLDADEFVDRLIFVGLIGFIDPPREEVKNAMDLCHTAGINPVMVTGDHPGTAMNIARQVHLIREGEEERGIHGNELEDILEKESDKEIAKAQVFSRVDPAQKLSIIEHFQNAGEIVGMTGDGVNDAPALKKADIGIAMGKRGTQVAQEVADMILQDDSFPSIVKAIKEGRIIFGNIRKFVMYQLSYHLAEIIIIGSISFTVFNLPLLPLQLLFMNLLSDVFPALALGLGKGTPGVMQRPPKDPGESIVTKQNWMLVGLYGLIISVFVSGSYFLAWFHWEESKETCNNIAFFSLAFAQLWHVFNMRESDEKVFINQVTRNKYIWYALAFCVTVLIAAYLIPGLNTVLSLQEMELRSWVLVVITSILPLITIQFIKFFNSRKK